MSNVSLGMLQGSGLGPFMFIVYINVTNFIFATAKLYILFLWISIMAKNLCKMEKINNYLKAALNIPATITPGSPGTLPRVSITNRGSSWSFSWAS